MYRKRNREDSVDRKRGRPLKVNATKKWSKTRSLIRTESNRSPCHWMEHCNALIGTIPFGCTSIPSRQLSRRRWPKNQFQNQMPAILFSRCSSNSRLPPILYRRDSSCRERLTDDDSLTPYCRLYGITDRYLVRTVRTVFFFY
jgi:hypothetical protein